MLPEARLGGRPRSAGLMPSRERLREGTDGGGPGGLPQHSNHGRSIGQTAERGGTRGFDGYKRVKGRKRYILVETLGLMIANRVEPANLSDRHAGSLLLFPVWLLCFRKSTA
jgi:hypothetical protein